MKNEAHKPGLQISADGRYFLDQRGNPLFWLGDTQWELFRAYTLEEAKHTLQNRKSKGFTFIQVMLLGVGASDQCDGRDPNAYGEKPWINDDPTTPNEAYFANVDRVMDLAAENGLVLVVGIYHARSGTKNPVQLFNARQWAALVAKRYRNRGNLIWSIYPRAEESLIPMVRELVAGLREGDGGNHLITVHPDPAPASSSSLYHSEQWLGFNTIQTFKHVENIIPMVTDDYLRKPTKPVVMAEGAYEAGIEYGFDVTPLWVRRQAYYTYLAGGHHNYGHNDSWRVWRSWKEALDAPGAHHLGNLKKAICGLPEWWRLVPDQSVLAGEAGKDKQLVKVSARHQDGRWIVVYIPERGRAVVRMDRMQSSKDVQVDWINPETGKQERIGRMQARGEKTFDSPDRWEDALLILRLTD
ncbi:MAG TPA: DUF4038 domain-containing protein [Spirochaetia bacterium]|nr:DUF4038 domain-containing protein [Spirochaetia bacterium]